MNSLNYPVIFDLLKPLFFQIGGFRHLCKRFCVFTFYLLDRWFCASAIYMPFEMFTSFYKLVPYDLSVSLLKENVFIFYCSQKNLTSIIQFGVKYAKISNEKLSPKLIIMSNNGEQNK